MGAVDVYRITDQLDDATLDVLIARAEARGKHPRFQMMMQEYLDAMAIDSAPYILDLGCGTGVVARTIARRPPFAGRVIGVDRSPPRRRGITPGPRGRHRREGCLSHSGLTYACAARHGVRCGRRPHPVQPPRRSAQRADGDRAGARARRQGGHLRWRLRIHDLCE